MLIPWGTDAPIYHWPFATVGLIVVNTLVFFATAALPPETQQSLMLAGGSGLTPLQWLTNNFMHADLFHLLGNMLFLWGFGIVVEGKLGWWRFLLVYLGLGITYGALMQILPVGSGDPDNPTYILGASAVIYGLLAMAMVWAPRNELQCIAFFRFVPTEWDIPILGFALFYIGIEVLFVALSRGALSSALLHTVGALLGLGLGILMLKLDWVDCENWDLFAVIENRTGKPALAKSDRPLKPRQQPRSTEKPVRPLGGGPNPSLDIELDPDAVADRSQAADRKMDRLIAMGDFPSTAIHFDKSARTIPAWPARELWVRWIQAMLKAGARDEVIPLMRAFCHRYPDRADRIRLRLAQLYLEQQRPVAALRALDEINPAHLPAELLPTHDQLARRARQLQDEGVLELEDSE